MEEKEKNDDTFFENNISDTAEAPHDDTTDSSEIHYNKKTKFFQPTQKGKTISVYAFLVALFYVLCVMLGINIHIVPEIFSTLISVLSPLIYGFIFAFVLTPAVRFFENKVFFKWKVNKQNLKHILCIVIVYVLVFAFIFLFVLFLVPQTVAAYDQFSSQLSVNIVTIRNTAASILDNFSIFDESNSYIYYNLNSDYRKELTDYVLVDSLNNPYILTIKAKNSVAQDEIQQIIDNIEESLLSTVTSSLPIILTSTINVLLEAKNVILGIIISVYFLISKNSIISTFNRIAHAWMPQKAYRRFAWMVNKAKNIFRDYIIVRLFDSLIVGSISLIGFLIIRNEYAFLLAVIIGLSAMIPFIGPVIGIVICAVMMMFLGFKYTLGFAIVMVIVHIIDDRLIEPLLTRGHSQHRLAGIWIFSAIIVMSGFFGFFGLLFGIPIFALIYSLIKDIAEKRLRQNGQSVNTESYGNIPFNTQKNKKTLLSLDQEAGSAKTE